MNEPSERTAGGSDTASVPLDQPLAVHGLRAGYGAGDVVNGVDLFVGEGELVALLGPNGAGKSTLLRALAGYLRLSAGSVYLFGEPATDPPYKRVRRGLGYLGEGRHVFPGLTVAQNLRLVRGGRADVVRRFPQLEARLHVRAGFISGGEQQMMSLGRALAAKPRVLVVDELSMGLAPVVRDSLLAMLRQVADRGVAVFVVEQSVKSVLEWADRAYVLRRGEIIDHRPAAEWRADLDSMASLFLS